MIIPLLFLGGCLAAVALSRSDTNGDSSRSTAASLGSLPRDPTVLPTQITAPDTTVAATEPVTTTAAPVTEPATEPGTEPATEPPASSATSRAPATSRGTAATTAATTATTARATTIVTAKPTTTATTRAVAASSLATFANDLAQQLATALAKGDWSRARALAPSSAMTDAKYGADYGNLIDSTVIPVKTTALSATTYAVRIGLVAHESAGGGGTQTVLYCAHWNVDTAKGTITQVSGTTLRTIAGTKPVSNYRTEVSTACATANLA